MAGFLCAKMFLLPQFVLQTAAFVYSGIFANNSIMKIKQSFAGLLIGTINSLLGAGGGLITVPWLNAQGLQQQKAQATSTFVILPLSALSTILYFKQGIFSFQDAWVFLPGGIIGAVLGGIFLKKIPAKALKLLFCAFMLYAGVRMILR